MSEYSVLAINRERGIVITEDDELCHIAEWHNDHQDGVDPAEATFVTFQFPPHSPRAGKWGYAVLSDFNNNQKSN